MGTIDAPDSRYVGPKEPHALRALFFDEIGDRTDVILEWRCMGGGVYACGSGNSPICGKMTPYDNLEEIKQFCRENPNDYPPAAITGRFPVSWICKGVNLISRMEIRESIEEATPLNIGNGSLPSE